MRGAEGQNVLAHPSLGVVIQRRQDQARARSASRSAHGSLCYCFRDFLLEVAE